MRLHINHLFMSTSTHNKKLYDSILAHKIGFHSHYKYFEYWNQLAEGIYIYIKFQSTLNLMITKIGFHTPFAS